MRRSEQMSEEDKVADADRRARDPQRHRRHAGRAGRPPRPRRAAPCRAFSPTRAAPRRAAGRRRGRRAAICVAFNGLGGFTPRRPRVRHHDHAASARRRRRGSTCSPTRGSAPSSARAAAPTRGARTRTSYRLTPWHNDPVSDASGEAFYLRDEETGRFWSPTPLPARAADAVHDAATASATASSSTPRTASRRELCTYVATDAPVKFVVLKLRNRSGRPRRLSVTGFFELVLGRSRAANAAARRHRDRSPRPARCSRATRTTASSPTRVAFLDCSETAAHGDRRPHRVPRPQRHAGRARRA